LIEAVHRSINRRVLTFTCFLRGLVIRFHHGRSFQSHNKSFVALVDHYNSFNCKFNRIHLHFTYSFFIIGEWDARSALPLLAVGVAFRREREERRKLSFVILDQLLTQPNTTARGLGHLRRLRGKPPPSWDS
jgi:hypothetical protein